eukprot:Stramenopile-MAST_4_protein_1792
MASSTNSELAARWRDIRQQSEIDISLTDTLLVGITTWNVGNAQPLLDEIPLLLGSNSPGSTKIEDLDVIVIGAQEAEYGEGIDDAKLKEKLAKKRSTVEEEEEDLDDVEGPNAEDIPSSAPSGKKKKKTTNCRPSSIQIKETNSHFYDAIFAQCAGFGFEQVRMFSLGEMRLMVLAHARVANDIKNVKQAAAACGIGHVMANKGGIVISMDYKQHSLCFATAHLNAHLKNLDRRNSDIREIAEEARIGNKKLNFATQFDYLFWMGDLNYRVDLWTSAGKAKPKEKGETHEKHWSEVKALVDAKNWKSLMAGDQLQRSMKASEVLVGFQEPEYKFLPTFKVLRQNSTVFKKQRSPAYCDRILWRVQPYLEKHHPVTVKEFYGVEAMSTSDHKPVRGVFEVKLVKKPDFSVVKNVDMVAQITLTNVRASNIAAADITGKSDPYLMVHMVPNQALVLPPDTKYLISKRKNQTLNPVYDDNDIPVILTNCKSVEDLKKTVLVLSIWDFDFPDPDDDLGDIVISFEKHAEGKKTGESFTLDVKQNIVHNTCQTAATMSATMTVNWVLSREATAVTTSHGCCTLL